MSNTDEVSKGEYQIDMSGEELLDIINKNRDKIEAEKNGTNTDTNDYNEMVRAALVTSTATTTGFPQDAVVSINDDDITISSDDGFEIKIAVNEPATLSQNAAVNTDTITIDITKMGPMIVQTGANEGQYLEIEIPALNAVNLGLDGLSVSTEDDATESIDKVAKAINQLSSVRSKIGAYANRLEHTITNLDTTEENMTEAYSRIIDTDMAEEMTEYSSMQVLVQAATSVLSQANERPQQVLQLLQ
jgi:flagellin